MKRFYSLLLILAFLMLPIVISASSAGELTLEEEVHLKLNEGFEAVAEAEREGGDVSPLVKELNQAIDLLEKGKVKGDEVLLRQALMIADDVIAKAPIVRQEGVVATQARRVRDLFVIGLLIPSAIIVWRYGPRLFWWLWVWSKRSWKCKV